MKARQLPYAGVLAGGLIAGALDILYAFAMAASRGGTPVRVLQSVASGLIGPAAYRGGTPTAALGLALYLGIAVAAAGVYASVACNSRWVRRHFVLSGVLFGAAVYLFMNFVVLPMSAVTFKTNHTPWIVGQGLLSHALLVGVPIAWAFNRLNPRANCAINDKMSLCSRLR
jgi:hypothetical protein